MPGLTVVHLEPTPNDRDPVGHMAAPTDHAVIQNTRKFPSLPISASCGFQAGNIMLPLGISLLHIVSKGLDKGQAGKRRAPPNRERIVKGRYDHDCCSEP